MTKTANILPAVLEGWREGLRPEARANALERCERCGLSATEAVALGVDLGRMIERTARDDRSGRGR